MSLLPKYAAFKSKYSDNYLRYVSEASQVQKFVQYTGESVLTPYTKYEVEQAKSDPTLVNIRCCYNNKYWSSCPLAQQFVIAGSDKPEEDKSKWNCTLFQPLYDNTHKAFRFRHIYRGFNVCLWRVGPPYGSCLIMQWSEPDRDLCDLCTVVDWETLYPLPKYLAFKGDNGKYLRGCWSDNRQYLQFSGDEIGNPTVGMESFMTKDGNIRLKSNYFGKFWRRSPDWIWADSTDTTTNNLDTVFSPVKIDDNIIALRNLGNNRFIKRLTSDGKVNCLNAAINTIDVCSRLQLEELVLSRDIYNMIFRPLDSIVYGESVVLMATQTATNTTNEPNTMNLNLNYTESKSSSWKSFVSMKVGVTTTITTGVPLISEGKIEISAEFSGGYEWGETIESSRQLVTTYKVTVPPRSIINVKLIATRGTCDVPYSYTQRDKLITGEIRTYQMDDGVYKGINSYNFKYDTQAKPLST